MTLRILVFGVLFVSSIILQSTLFHYLKIAGVKPDLLLVIVILYSILKGEKHGARLGFVFGLLEDLLVGRYIGLQALTKMTVGYTIGLLERKVYQDNIIIPAGAAFAGTVLHGILCFIILFLTGSYTLNSINFLPLTAAAAFYNVLIALIIRGRFFYSNRQGLLRA